MSEARSSTRDNMVELIKKSGEGWTIADICRDIGIDEKTYEYYRATYEDFKNEIDTIRIQYKRSKNKIKDTEVPDFPEFSSLYLKNKLYQHQLQWYDMLEGREPRELHPAMTYFKGKLNNNGEASRLIINTPPGHAKSTTITVNYVVWRIIKNPNIKIIIVSKAQRLAEQFLLQIKERLTSPDYEELARDFAPPNGWKDGSASWKQNQFYLGGRSAEAKDPTVQAVGIRGQVYGARADLIIVDDAIDNTNVSEYDKQIDWLLGVVGSRLSSYGKLLVVGTRIAAKDMYSELLNGNRYNGGSSPWTYLLQKAVLEYAEDPEDWVTLWPYSELAEDPDQPQLENGLYRKRDGFTLNQIREMNTPAQWSRMFQQEQVAEDSVFKIESVVEACEGRMPGTMPAGTALGRKEGMQGLRIIAGLDPAAAGYTACVVYGVDVNSGHRYVIDIFNKAGTKPDEMRSMIKGFTDKYNVNEWRIESNAFQSFLTNDTEIKTYLANRGVVLTPHTTGNNKHDPDFGVMAMSSLFENGIIHLPTNSNDKVQTLIEQLITWQPKTPKGIKTDIVMALWFAELRALELVTKKQRSKVYRDTPFTTVGDMKSRFIVSNNAYNLEPQQSTKRVWGR